MKYLSSLLLFENVAQSKVLLKKLNIELTNPDYLKIRDLIKGHDGYAYWFTKLRFVDNQPYEELSEIWNTIKSNPGLISRFTKEVVQLASVEEFWDQIEKAKIISGAKSVLNQFPAAQRGFLKLDDADDLLLLNQLSKSKSLPALIRKISSFRDKKSFVDAANRLLKSQMDGTFDKILQKVNEVGAEIKVANEVENIIICRVNYKQITVLGGDTSWCIVRSASTFDSYANGGFQWVIFLTDMTDKMSKIGLTTKFDYHTAHDKFDGHISKQNIVNLLKERDVDFYDLVISLDDLRKMKNWNDIPVESLVSRVTKEEIVEKKKVFKKFYSGYSYKESDLSFFTKEEVDKYSLLDKAELDFNDLLKLDKSVILSKNCIQRLTTKPHLSSVIENLKLTKKEIIDNKIYKSCYVNGSALSFFTKEELVKNGIIDIAENIEMSQFISAGFTKKEVMKSYHNSLDYKTKNIINFFQSFRGKIGVLKRLRDTFWNDDWEKLGVSRDNGSRSQTMLNIFSLYEITSSDIPLLSDKRGYKVKLSDYIDDKLLIRKSNIDTLYKLGYKVNNNLEFNEFIKLFGIEQDSNSIKIFGQMYNFWEVYKDIDQDSSKMMRDLIDKKINGFVFTQSGRYNSPFRFDYWSYIEEKNAIKNKDFFNRIKEKIKEYVSNDIKQLRTNRDQRSYSDVNVDNTISYARELGFTKSDYDDYMDKNSKNISDFVFDLFDDDVSDYDFDKIFTYLTDLKYKLTNDIKISIIKKCLKNAKSNRGDEEYSTDYYELLISNKLDIKNSYKQFLKSISTNRKLGTYDESNYKKLFKDAGEGLNKQLSDIIAVIKQREFDDKVDSELKHLCESQYRTSITAQKWYEDYFNTFVESRSRRTTNYYGYAADLDRMALIVLAKMNKLSEADKLGNFDFSRNGRTFDDNLLHTLCKIITKSGSTFGDYKKLELNDDNLKNLYEWVISKVDESIFKNRKYLQVCYYLYDPVKYENYIDDVAVGKNNYKYSVTARATQETATRSKTVRIHDLRYTLSYLASTGDFTEFKRIVERIFSYYNPSAPRSLKMGNQEYKDSIDILARIGVDSYKSRDMVDKFSVFQKTMIKYANSLSTPSIKESFILKWNDFN